LYIINSADITGANRRRYYWSNITNIGNIIFKDKEFSKLSQEQKLLQYPAILKQSGYVGGRNVKIGEYDFPNDCYRIPSVLELERLMTIFQMDM
jgi:hypothetical protein